MHCTISIGIPLVGFQTNIFVVRGVLQFWQDFERVHVNRSVRKFSQGTDKVTSAHLSSIQGHILIDTQSELVQANSEHST